MASFLKTIDFGLRTLLFNKFDDILNLESINRGVILYPKEVAFRMISEKKGAMLSEFINLWRTKTAPSWERQRTPVARRGFRLAYTDNNQTDTITVKAMPVDLSYDIWFWTKDIDNLYLIAEKYLFWQQDNPNLSLYYNTTYPVELDLHFGEMTDESNVFDMLNRGNHFCMRVPIRVDGWVYTSEEIGVIQKIELVLYDNTNLSEYRECISEATDYYDADTEQALRLYEEHVFGIIALDVDTNSFTVNKDNASEFVTGEYLYVDNGRYTIVSATDGDDYTTVTVLEEIENVDEIGETISLKNL
ncbi:MAG: hypothetical protein ACTSUP_01170 [Candidatus Heimdallarchaeaceae archaeon]